MIYQIYQMNLNHKSYIESLNIELECLNGLRYLVMDYTNAKVPRFPKATFDCCIC